MKINSFILGDFQTNCYCLCDKETDKDCLLIDTGMAPEPLVDFLKQNGLNPEVVVFTHGHADHIAGINLLRENFPDVRAAIHTEDAKMLANPVKNLSVLAGELFKAPPAEIIIEKEGPIKLAGFTFEILHTPGHTPGGICLYLAEHKAAFVGDTLFEGSIGRTDFPDANYDQLIQSIKTKLLTLPDDTTVYTGHGPATTIAREKKSNPFLQ